MAQVSYGTITITDTNDIESIIMEYAQSSSNSTAPTSGWSENIPTWEQDKYIWQRTRIHKSGTDSSTDEIGDPVCLTGSTGATGTTGRGVSSIVTTYCNYGTGTPAASYSGWSSTVPVYDSTKPNYWVKTVITYTSGTPATDTSIYKDNGLTDATSTAADANTTAQAANTTANQANTNASNALSIANAANTTATGINQHFWWLESDTTTTGGTLAAGSYITDIFADTFKSNPGSYGNLLLRSDGVYLNLGLQTIASFTGTALTFNNPSTGQTQLTIGSSGALQSGDFTIINNTSTFSSLGTKIDLTYGEIYTPYFRVSQGSITGGPAAGVYITGNFESTNAKIGGTKQWNIRTFTDSQQATFASITGTNQSFIQLGASNTWLLNTNKIHSAWYVNGNYLAYPSLNSKYYDFGINLPTSLTDKFLYIRYNTSSDLATIYQNDDNWVYSFYIDGSGNVHAPGFYIGDSATPIGGGAGTVAERLTQGYGSATQPIYFNSNGVPTNTTYQLNAAGAKGVDTSISAASTSTNLPTSQAVAAFVEGKGYSTTDNKVQTSQANTTKIYLAGTSTAGTSTGTLNFDSNVYLTTTAGTLHATTFEGNLSGTASRATADGDGNTIKTTYLKLSGGNVTGAVTFGSSVSADELTVGDLVVNGSASFTNNLQANTINGVEVGASPKFTDTTYTFTNGTNGFTVTPLGGTAQTVTVTPSIANNVTGSGTSGYLAKFTGTNTIGNGPALGSDTTKFLNNKGEWAVPAGTYTYTLPLAANGTRGGVQIGYTTSGKNYAVQLSSEKMYVNVPWENTTYSAGTGLSLSGTTFNHSNSVTAGTAGTSSATSGATLAVPYVTYDAQGHITGTGTHTHTISGLSADVISGGYLNIHPENSPTLIPFIHNDIAHLLKRGGSAVIKYDDTTQSLDLTNCFDGSGSYWAINPTNITTITIELTLHKVFGWTNTIYIDFGASGWRAKSVKIEVMNSNYTNDVWTQKYNTTSNSLGHVYVITSHQPVGADNTGGGFNKIRFTFSSWATATIFRIAQLGVYNYGSAGLRETYMSRGADDPIFRSITPYANNTYNLGSSSNKWNTVYATTFNGTATGNVTSVQYDTTNKKITYTKNNANTDVVTIATIKTDLGSMPASDVYSWAKASTKPSYSYSEIGSAPDAIVDATVNSQGVIVLTKNSGGTVTLSTEIAVVESQGANKLVEAGSTTGISVGSSDKPVYFSSGIPVAGYYIPKLNGSNQSSAVSFYAPTAAGTAKQILVSSGSGAPGWQTVATGGTNGTIKIGSDEYAVKGLAAAAYKALADSSSASAIGTGTNATTERDVYYGLPTINNAHNYTSSTTIYAPTTGGTSTQVLIGNGTTSAPVWTDISGLVPSSATNATNATYATYDASEANNTTKTAIADKYIPKSIGTAAGDIIYWSAANTPVRLAKGNNGQVLKLANGVPTWGTDNNDNTTYMIATGDSNGQIKVTPSSGDAYNVSVKGLGSNAYTSTAYLPLAGGTMTGQIKTSFKSSIAVGSTSVTSSTVPDLCEELRYSSGVMGSVSITTAYTKDSITIATGWYNFLWVPHRSGGLNGAASGDNCDYGSLYLSGMTLSGLYMIRYTSKAIAEVKNLYKPPAATSADSATNATNATNATYATYDASETGTTKTTIANKYLKLSGGTMSGNITMGSSSGIVYTANPVQFLRWTTSTTDNNSTGRSWYGIGTYTNTDDNNYNWLNISNYWGINITTRGNTNLRHNNGIIPHTNNTSGTVGSATQPVYISGGIITAGTSIGASAYHADDYFVRRAGDTMTGALNTANGTANKIGDDSQLGDFNVGGTLGIQGLNSTTGIGLLQQGTTWGSSGNYAHITYDGTYVKLNKLLQITASGNTVTIGSQNASFTHIYNSLSIPFIFNNSILTTSGSLGNTTYPFTNVNITGAYNMLVSGVQKAAMHYDSTLDAIVFSFA